MVVTYPLSAVALRKPRKMTLAAKETVGYTESPFSGDVKTFLWSNNKWMARVELPPMTRANAEQWLGLLLALRGMHGCFLLGDHVNASPRGTATSATITGVQDSSTVTVIMTGTLLAGDYFQVGTGATAELHKVTVDRSGNGDLEIWPPLRLARTAAALVLTNPVGQWRLASNEMSWDIDQLNLHGISIELIEKVPS